MPRTFLRYISPAYLLWIIPASIALAFSIVFISLLPTTPRDFQLEKWVPPMGVKPLADDAHEYLALADSIRSEGEYSRGGEGTRMRQPLYPMFLVGIQSIFGTNIRFVQVLQALLIAGTVVIFYSLARRIFDARISFLAALFLSIYIPFTVRAALVISETLFIFLMFLSLYLVVAALQEQRGKHYIAGGVVLGLAFLTRPNVILLPLALIPVLIFFARHQTSMGRAILLSSVFTLAFLAVLVPWTIRNAVVLGEYTPLPSSGGVNLWITTHPDWKEFVNHGTAYAWELDEFFDIQGGDYYISSEADGRFFREATENIKDDPQGWLSRNIKKLAWVSYYSFFQELRPSLEGRSLVSRHTGFANIMHAATLIFIFLLVLGLLKSLHKRESILLFTTMVYFLFVAWVSFAESRYLLPIVPLYLLFAASALAMLAKAAWSQFSWMRPPSWREAS